MKTKVMAVTATVLVAAGLIMFPRGESEPIIEEPVKYWTGDFCPITGNKYSEADRDNAMQGNVPLRFEHEGMNYEAYVWNDAAVDEFESNRDKYVAEIVANSE